MDVKQAISKAKTYLSQVFADENISEIRLEEVDFDERAQTWNITLGLMRPSLSARPDMVGHIANLTHSVPLKRTYKIVRIPDDGHGVPSIKIREIAEG